MRFQAVIFDLDGTLADTLDDIADAMNEALRQLGFPTHDREDYKELVGRGVEDLARRALPPGREDLVPEAVKRFRAHYAAHIVDHTRPFPAVPAMLDALERSGVRMAVLSNKIDAMTKRIVASCFSRWRFDVVFGEREGIPRKPDPTSALEVASRLGVRPEACAFVGDTAIDMKTAANAGMYGIGVTWGFRPREELEASGAKVIIDRPEELPAIVTG